MVWTTSTVLAVGMLVTVGFFELPANPTHDAATVLLRSNGDGLTTGAPTRATTGKADSRSSAAAVYGSATVGSAAGQPVTKSASHAFTMAAQSPQVRTVPSTFEPDLAQLYRSVYTAAQTSPKLAQFVTIEDPAQFSASLGRLSKRNAGELYGAVQSGSGLKGLTTAVNSFIPVERATVRELQLRPASHEAAPRRSFSSHTATANPSSHTATANVSGSSSPQDLTIIPDTMPQIGSFGGGVAGTAYIVNCPSYWSTSIDPYADNAIYALQIVIDVASGVYNVASHFDDAFPVSVIATALILVAQEVQNDGVYLKGDYANCEDNNVQEAGLDIDNSTYQTYELLASVAGTANEADTNLVALINQNAAAYQFQLEGVIEGALTQPTATAPMASLELPSTAGGYLDSTPVGVQSVVTTEIANLEEAGQLTSPLAYRDLGLAGQAYAAGEYKLAFQYYRLAYQAAAE